MSVRYRRTRSSSSRSTRSLATAAPRLSGPDRVGVSLHPGIPGGPHSTISAHRRGTGSTATARQPLLRAGGFRGSARTVRGVLSSQGPDGDVTPGSVTLRPAWIAFGTDSVTRPSSRMTRRGATARSESANRGGATGPIAESGPGTDLVPDSADQRTATRHRTKPQNPTEPRTYRSRGRTVASTSARPLPAVLLLRWSWVGWVGGGCVPSRRGRGGRLVVSSVGRRRGVGAG